MSVQIYREHSDKFSEACLDYLDYSSMPSLVGILVATHAGFILATLKNRARACRCGVPVTISDHKIGEHPTTKYCHCPRDSRAKRQGLSLPGQIICTESPKRQSTLTTKTNGMERTMDSGQASASRKSCRDKRLHIWRVGNE